MDNKICYLNTDLVLTSPRDLAALSAYLESKRVGSLHGVTRDDDGLYHDSFETDDQFTEPESNIAAMLAVVESFDAALRSIWDGCSRREFNIGYDCGAEPWAFNQGLSAGLLRRIVAVGASLHWTLYPDRENRTVN